MRGSRGVRVVDESDDTLTESSEGAVNFMVVEILDGSLHQVRLWECCECRLNPMRAAPRRVGSTKPLFFFAFTEKKDHQT